MDAKVESGLQAVAAVLIEQEGETRKLFRVVLPLGMKLPPGTRIIIDQNQPRTAPYIICFANGCMVDYEANEELIGNMKKGQTLIVQAVNGQGQVISLRLPLNEFGKAYDGPPSYTDVLRGGIK
jgi:invasion protein IalB